jgi:4-hydroxy-tetrahydrodipicolinate reductase
MGRLSTTLVRESEDLDLAGELDLEDDLPAGVEASGAEVVLDFTHHSVAMENFRRIVAVGARPVSGTSGFSEDDLEEAGRLLQAAELGGIIVPNFSVGAVLMMRFAREAARRIPHVEIVEIHHDRKGDAPSGTAEATARMIAVVRGDLPPAPVHETERFPGARGGRAHGVPVHSLRLPSAVAHQEVIFSGPGELLTVRHDSLSRECFRAGILLALRKVREVEGLVYGLEPLL